MTQPKRKDAGFTIIELTIATAIFTVILLIVVMAIMGIQKLYSKGNIQAQTQDVARSVMDSISDAISLGVGSISQGTDVLCVGTQQYSFSPAGQQVSGGNQGLMYYDAGGSCIGKAADMTDGTEMLGNNMRVANISVSEVDNKLDLYNIDVRVVYGDPDLLCVDGQTVSSSSNSQNVDCTPSSGVFGENSDITSLTSAQVAKLRCKNSGAGNEFCSMAELSTMVRRRMQ